jgi:hypothetical protein
VANLPELLDDVVPVEAALRFRKELGLLPPDMLGYPERGPRS